MIKIGPLLCSVFGPSGRTVGPIVIKFEIVPFEIKLAISYKYELNWTNQISVVPKKAKIGPSCRRVNFFEISASLDPCPL